MANINMSSDIQIPIPNLSVGQVILIKGKIPPTANVFNIDLADLYGNEFYFSMRVDFIRNIVSRNSALERDSGWGVPEIDGPFPFIRPMETEIYIIVEVPYFKVLVNGAPYCQFLHRAPYNKINGIRTYGDFHTTFVGLQTLGQGQQIPQCLKSPVPAGYAQGAPVILPMQVANEPSVEMCPHSDYSHVHQHPEYGHHHHVDYSPHQHTEFAHHHHHPDHGHHHHTMVHGSHHHGQHYHGPHQVTEFGHHYEQGPQFVGYVPASGYTALPPTGYPALPPAGNINSPAIGNAFPPAVAANPSSTPTTLTAEYGPPIGYGLPRRGHSH